MVVTAMTITWPAFNKDIELEDPLIIIDMVDIAEVTNVASASEGAPQDEVDQDKARLNRLRHHRRPRRRSQKQRWSSLHLSQSQRRK